MPYYCSTYPILKKTEIAKDIYSFVISCPDAAAAAKRGRLFTLRRRATPCAAPFPFVKLTRKRVLSELCLR